MTHRLILTQTFTAALVGVTALATAQPAFAQAARATVVQPQDQIVRIHGLDVAGVDKLEPGTELEFTVWGTPDAQAVLNIDGASRNVALSQVSGGYYKGYYTVSSRDRIAPNARVVANLRLGNQVATAQLNEPLVKGYTVPATSAATAPRIERLDISQGEARREGQEVTFALTGTPGGQASVRIPGAAMQSISLAEQKAGSYGGSYTITAVDQIQPGQPVTARLTVGERVATSSLNANWDKPLPAVGLVGSSQPCADCWTVIGNNTLQVDGSGNYVGTVAGGVLGGVLGNQVGGGDGRRLATVAGAIGGALAGREIERRNTDQRRTTYEIILRNTRGEQRAVTQSTQPDFKVGDVVRITSSGALERAN